jgi:GNAT superfamily N-acetyltransferase
MGRTEGRGKRLKGDGGVRDAELLALYDREMRVAVEFFDARREATADVIRQVSLHGPEGAILWARFDPARTDEVIDAQMAYFERIGQGCEWKVYTHDTQPLLKERLLANGFQKEEAEAVMVLETTQAPTDLLGPVAVDVRRLEDPDGLDDIRAIEQAVWNEDFTQLVQNLGAERRHDSHQASFYVAYAEERPAGCAWIRYHRGSQFASLWGGATLPEYRKRGLYTALVAVRLQAALERGVRYLTVDASPMSAPILQRYGFRQIATCTPFKWRAP